MGCPVAPCTRGDLKLAQDWPRFMVSTLLRVGEVTDLGSYREVYDSLGILQPAPDVGSQVEILELALFSTRPELACRSSLVAAVGVQIHGVLAGIDLLAVFFAVR